MKLQYSFILTLICVCFVSCSGKNFPLKGKVTYEDGTPLTKGTVNFSSETSLSRAKIQSDGSYVVGTLKETDGIPRGKYKVYITGAEEPIESKTKQTQKDSMGNTVQSINGFRQLIERKYITKNDTPLECEIPIMKNRFDITIEKPVYLK
ncbi:MAG: hypothetical protein LBJ67_14755 [Planctomycetaceae bacterium]|jgi:hypothetical protein|nr:hypothetical protein [Planctomycetaceae bacterium]